MRVVPTTAATVALVLLGFAAAAFAAGVPAPDPAPQAVRPAATAEPAAPAAKAKAPGPAATTAATTTTATTAPQETGPQPLRVTPPLAGTNFVFPVVGSVEWGDSYGVPRPDVPTGWHHGNDLFAPIGAPVVAVTDGSVSSVGWEELGGWRLWLTDSGGDSFYYAHLSGYSALALHSPHVRAGQVLGFVGRTGDADGGAPHLHFEIHPASLRYLGENGAVDPTRYLAGWRHLDSVSFAPPLLPAGSAGAPRSEADRAFRELLGSAAVQARLAEIAAARRERAAARRRRAQAARAQVPAARTRRFAPGPARLPKLIPGYRIPVAGQLERLRPKAPAAHVAAERRSSDSGSGLQIAGIVAVVSLAGVGLLLHRGGWLRRAFARGS
jgi:septal ring factor EnvC (AmiA/AmiB activator)